MAMTEDKKKSILMKKYKPVIGIVLYVVSLVIIYLIADLFYQAVKKQETKITDQKNLIPQKEQTIKDILLIKDTFPDFQDRVRILDSLVFHESDVGASQFLAQIDQIAKKSNVRINSISPSSEEGRVSATLVISGDQSSTLRFIKNIEKNMLIINVEKLTMTIGSGNNLTTVINLKTGG